jgi:hypothetical protein
MEAKGANPAITGSSQALAYPVVRKGIGGDFILCGLSPPVSPQQEMVSQYTF